MVLQNALGDLALDSTLVEVLEALLTDKDLFGNSVVGCRYNMVELHFDDTNWNTYGTETRSGGAPVGAQANGRVEFRTGTGTNGQYLFESLDNVLYRGGLEVYGTGTHAFLTPPTAPNDSYFYYPLGETQAGTVRNGVGIGYKNPGAGMDFGIRYVKGGVEQLWKPRSQWLDQCNGSPGSKYTKNGVPVNLDETKGKIWRVSCGLFNYHGWSMFVFSPDRKWVELYRYDGQSDAEPVFTNNDLKTLVQLVKGAGSNAVNFGGRSGCWVCGRMTDQDRISDPLTGRSLVKNTRSVIFAKTPSNSYVEVTCNSQGRLQVTNDSVQIDGAAFSGSASVMAGVDAGGLVQAMMLEQGGKLPSARRYSTTVGRIAFAGRFTTDQVIIPSVGKRIRVVWVNVLPATIVDPVGNYVEIKFASQPNMYAGEVIGHWESFEGAVDETVVINLTNTEPVDINIHYEEF